MKKIIHHVRRQPEEIRRHILHFLTAVAGIVLVMLWFYSLGRNLNNPDTQVKVNNELKPFSVLKGNIIDGYQSITNPNPDTELEIE
ncbi:hypothetical protein A2641_03470 [Candidatus Nomurabacteria bacterium RIFCSPHIGHO2_01_FULL_37_25]|uniref:Uncharacterized protein n=1 Tax=Candidatus Nomurabacteria bacterium RIFCSPLOWO2_01_FULL_36_16 TaxID=1801767 RepID=A0A1F6WZR1_9BACT|nr:MAG: hypothetical protein A2641_03470 [Candidatus Nomurabacteria bacterium RIFCSPHIGHO2_01_FULL_37_25]OGI75549.1 MAG: hypothetical protein A3D36_03115 [Candidatus Nomurabacteria bacterium RIFCSPHIGHO2_02_FULL_36_29]OGI87387.1 MAG: hypothetical protein A3A91_02735 [Candidatus Nomurabacteria bacterium RIFCSPLOWO2_01_FULL_36_16]OGI96865.1 MAG: hypothetical protein A3I84_03050 [Candidatus Nomurabacteria bacterium RIFCSPLOWO2_02_FULL_36_8]